MAWIYFLVLGPPVAGVVLAFVWWLIWGRKSPLPGGTVAWVTLLAGLVLVFGGVAREFTD